MPEKQRLLRFTILCRRNKNMSEDEFQTHWSTEHPALVKDWMAKYKIVNYTQYHTPSSIRSKTEKLAGSLGEITSAEYDGFVEMTIREDDFEMLSKAREDPYYLDVIQKDEAKIMDMEGCRQILGWTEVYVENGQAVQNAKNSPNVITA